MPAAPARMEEMEETEEMDRPPLAWLWRRLGVHAGGTRRATCRHGRRLAAQGGGLRPPNPPPMTYTLSGGTVLDGRGGRIPQGTVVLRDGRIAAVGAAGQVPESLEGERLDTTGRTVMPGVFMSTSR